MQARKATFEGREYGKNPLSEKELREIMADGPVERYLNTRTPLYRERNMKKSPPTREEAIRLMLKDPNLLKRPVIVMGKTTLSGFDEAALNKIL